jgi:hypothetical protein
MKALWLVYTFFATNAFVCVLIVLVLVVLCDDVWCCAGGIRANAFVTGGFLPEDRRGVREEGFMTTADWYATYAGLAGTGRVSSFYCSM